MFYLSTEYLLLQTKICSFAFNEFAIEVYRHTYQQLQKFMEAAELAFSQAISAIRKEYGCSEVANSPSESNFVEENGGEKEAMANMIVKKFQHAFDVPPIAEIEFLIHKTFSLAEVRFLLFCPLDKQIGYYVTILNATNSNQTSIDFLKVRNLILSLIFLIHRYFLSNFRI